MGGIFSDFSNFEIKEIDIGIKKNYLNTIEELFNLFEQNKGKIIVITGAGISSNSLPTFRSRDRKSVV